MEKSDCEKLISENKHLKELVEKNEIIIKQHELIVKLWQVVKQCPYCKENNKKSRSSPSSPILE